MKTRYIIVEGMGDQTKEVAKLLDEGWEIIASWVTRHTVHHILTAPEQSHIAAQQ